MHSIHTKYRRNSKSRKLLCYYEHNHVFTCKQISKFICHTANFIRYSGTPLSSHENYISLHVLYTVCNNPQSADSLCCRRSHECSFSSVLSSSLLHLICRNPTQYHLRNLVLRLLEFHLSARNHSQMIPQRSRAALQQIASISHAHVQEKHT